MQTRSLGFVLVTALVVAAGCNEGRPALTLRGSTPCPLSSRVVETWCDDVGNCELRVSTGAVFRCNAGDSAGCTRASMDAATACQSGAGDGGGSPADGGATLPNDAGSRRDAGPPPPCTGELDLLLLVDNSGSMSEEQAALVDELPQLVRQLSEGDRDGDGRRDFDPLRSIHVGVVTSDMGTAGYDIPTCNRGTFGRMFGDDGVLRARAGAARFGCSSSYPSVLAFASGDDRDQFANDVACLSTTGTDGCGLEQQLEAVLKALSPSRAQPWTAPDWGIRCTSTVARADARRDTLPGRTVSPRWAAEP